VENDLHAVRSRINMVSGGEISGYGLLTVRENLWMFSQFYGIKSKVAKAKIDELLIRFGMEDKRDAKVRTLSTGQRQKMNVIRGFVTNPEILFLDEPTLGLDVNASRQVRDFILEWVSKDEGRTVVLTTHYMAEADELCDRIAIIDDGKILACDTPTNLKRLVKTNTTLSLDVTMMKDVGSLSSIRGASNFTSSHTVDNNMTNLRFVLEDESAVSDIVSEILAKGSKIVSLQKKEPTLEDVFIKLVGKGLG
jgi:ABC-2 type transport system ATP-binding protein